MLLHVLETASKNNKDDAAALLKIELLKRISDCKLLQIAGVIAATTDLPKKKRMTNTTVFSSSICWPNKRSKGLRILHSSEFTEGSHFAGQHVVVVGLGESGSDISLLVARHAATVKISVRSSSGSSYILS